MKKTLVTFIIMIITMVLCVAPVQAASFGVKITPNKTEVKRGESVTLVVAVNNINVEGKGLTALYSVIEYDTTVFNPLEASNFKALNGWDTPTFNTNNNKILTAKGAYETADTNVFEITLTTKATAPIGNTSVTLKNITGSDNESDIAVANVSCALQITGTTTTPPEDDGNQGTQDKPTVTVKPKVTASYEKVANGIKVTLTSDKELKSTTGWELSSDKKKLSRVYTSNYSGTIVVKDVNGVESEAIPINVELGSQNGDNQGNGGNTGDGGNGGTTVDKTAPTATVKYTKGTNGVTVTVTASEQVKPVTGWTLSSDKKTLTRLFAADYTGTITVEDLSGNQSKVLQIKVDMKDPNGGTNDNGGSNGGNTPNPGKPNGNNGGNAAKDPLPEAGMAYILPGIALVAIIGTVAFIRYKSMEY